MDIQEGLMVSGRIVIQLTDHDTGEVHTFVTDNLVTDSGLDLLAGLLAQQPGVTGVTHLAVGTGRTAPAPTDTELEAETYRVPITRVGRGATGRAEIECFLSRAMANLPDNQRLGELGLFAGDQLYARALFPAPIPKNKGFSLIVSWSSRIKPEVV